MEELLRQVALTFKPMDGKFDVEQVAAVISTIGFPYRDVSVPSIFLIFMDEDSKQSSIAWRLENPSLPLPYVLLIDVKPEQIYVNLFAGSEFKPYAQTFIGWLIGHYTCSVSNEEGTDLSHYSQNHS